MPLRILSRKGAVQIMPFRKLGRKCHFFVRFCMRKRSETYVLQQTEKSNCLLSLCCIGGVSFLPLLPSNGRRMSTNLCTKRNKCCISGIFQFCSPEESFLLDYTNVRLMQPIQLQLLQVTGMLPFHQVVGSLLVLTR